MNEERRVKQVICVRHDLKMRRGKQIAQGSHASMSFICRRLQEAGSVSLDDFSEAERTWITGAFAKVCCRVDSEEELIEIHDKALEAGLEVHLITDTATEFHRLLTDGTIESQKPDGEEIVASMKRAKIDEAGFVHWSEVCHCPTPRGRGIDEACDLEQGKSWKTTNVIVAGRAQEETMAGSGSFSEKRKREHRR